MTEEINYHVFNAGGARHKRQDWVHAFQGVHHWYYVASLAEYDICLNEDKIAVSGCLMTRNFAFC